MNEFLFVFGSEDYMVCKEVTITEFDLEHFRIKATGCVCGCFHACVFACELLDLFVFVHVCSSACPSCLNTLHICRRGEAFRIGKHPQGTEVKAITYSNMQIHHDKPTHDVYVIIDI